MPFLRLLLAPVCLTLAVLCSAAPAARAQNFTEEQRKVWIEIDAARQLNDQRALERIARRNDKEMQGIFDVIQDTLAYSDDVKLWEDLKVVGKALDDAGSTNVYQIRMDLLMKMPVEQRGKRLDMCSRYFGVWNTSNQAMQKRELETLKTSLATFEELAAGFEAIGDLEFQCYSLAQLAKIHELTENKLETVKLYAKIDDVLTRGGYQNFNFHAQIKAALESMKAAGFDPSAAPGDAPAGNTGTSWAKDPAGERWSDPEPVTVVIDEDLPFKFVTPAPSSGENTVVWESFNVPGQSPVDFDPGFKPFGNPLRFQRTGAAKVTIDDGQGKPQEVRVISKPTLVTLKRTGKDFDNNDVDLAYAFVVACGNNPESFFGMELNGSPTAENMGIRYRPACYLKSRVLGEEVLIFDDNSSGQFGDQLTPRLGVNTEQPEFTYNDAMMVGRAKAAGPWTEYMEKDGAFYRLKVNAGELTMVTRKLDVDTGTVRLDYAAKGGVVPEVVVIEETNFLKGAFFAIDKKPVTVPVGRYRVSYGIIRKGSKQSQKSCLMLTGKATSFDVKKGEESVVSLGAPFSFDFKLESTPEGVKVVGKSVIVYGRGNEMYTRFYDEPPTPDKVALRVKGGGPAGKPDAMKNANIDDYQKDGSSVWQPLDLLFDVDPNQSYEAQLSLKKHPLIGGPIKSEWQG